MRLLSSNHCINVILSASEESLTVKPHETKEQKILRKLRMTGMVLFIVYLKGAVTIGD